MTAGRLLCAFALFAAGCAAPPTTPRVASVRERLTSQLADVRSPLRLRYNPAACDCPPFELRVGRRWVRAAWPGLREPRWQRLSQRLGASRRPDWPVLLVAKGSVDKGLKRTRAGVYVVTVEVDALLAGPNS